MVDQNIILITMDEVRPDHLSCYGYQRITTLHLDEIAHHGVLFETCIASSCLTPICCASILTGTHPSNNGIRDPFCMIQVDTIARILNDKGYATAGFVGNGLLGVKHGFQDGFDFFDEPTGEESWATHQYPDQEHPEEIYGGSWWVDRMLDWLRSHAKSRFFIWGHYFETHEGAERKLLERGLIKEGHLSEFSYYDAKIQCLDEKLMGPLLHTLKAFGIYENTILIVMSDHGTTLGEHPAEPIPWRWGTVKYPQHTSMYDVDLKVSLLMKGQGLPRRKRIKGMTRAIDLVPTLLALTGIETSNKFDGVNLLPLIERGEVEGLSAYAEDLYERRGPGALQVLRTDDYKFMRNLSTGEEGFYDLRKDPEEQRNLLPQGTEPIKNLTREIREKLNLFLWKTRPHKREEVISEQDREKIEARLRALGYVR